MSRIHAALLLALCCLAVGASATSRRHLSQDAATPAPAASYPSLADALAAAASGAPNLSTLLAAVQAAGVASSLSADTAWTILAPTNDAFTSRLNTSLNLTPQDLLKPENNATLVKVLSYHVIPAGALTSSQLTNGQVLATALTGASLTVVTGTAGGSPTVTFQGASNNATVVVPNIVAGKSVIHVIDDVLLPA